MIKDNDVLAGLLEQLKSNPTMINQHARLSIGECVNEDEGSVPWVGIYLDNVKHDPATIGVLHNRWRAEVDLIIVAQQTSLKSGADCMSRLSSLVRDTLNVIVNDTTFGNKIDAVRDIDISYSYNKTDNQTLHFQSAYIKLKLDVENNDDDC